MPPRTANNQPSQASKGGDDHVGQLQGAALAVSVTVVVRIVTGARGMPVSGLGLWARLCSRGYGYAHIGVCLCLA